MKGQPIARNRCRRAASLGAVAVVLVASIVVATGASARPVATARPAAQSSTLNWGLQSTIATLNWIKGWSLNIPPALSLSMEGLLTMGPQENLLPGLASSWKQVSPTVYRYYLRHNAKFWDGHPVTAADVEATYGYISDAASASPLYSVDHFNNIKYVIARDKYTVEIRLKKADALFKYQVTTAAGWVTEGSFLRAHHDDMGTPGALIMGTGPYEVTGFAPDQSVTYKRNPLYWGAKAKYAKVVLHEIPDQTTRQLAVQSGQIDGALGVVPGSEAQWQTNGVTTAFGPDNYMDVISFNTTAAPWNDIHIRRMVADAINRPALINNVLGGHVTAANWFAPPPTTGWGGLVPAKTLAQAYKGFPAMSFNMDKAKAELAASSTPKGFSATVYYPDNHPENGQLALSLAQNLKSIGVDLTVQKIPYPTWIARAFGHSNLGMEFGYFGLSYYDPSAGLDNFLDTANARANGLNLANFSNPAVDAELATANDGTKSDAVRGKAVLSAVKAAHDDLAYLPLWWGKVGIALRQGVKFTSELGPVTFAVDDWADFVTTK